MVPHQQGAYIVREKCHKTEIAKVHGSSGQIRHAESQRCIVFCERTRFSLIGGTPRFGFLQRGVPAEFSVRLVEVRMQGTGGKRATQITSRLHPIASKKGAKRRMWFKWT